MEMETLRDRLPQMVCSSIPIKIPMEFFDRNRTNNPFVWNHKRH